MRKTKGLLFLGVLFSTLIPFAAIAQDIAFPQDSKIDIKISELSVYPNPVDDRSEVTIALQTLPEVKWTILEMRVHNMTGEIVYAALGEDFGCKDERTNPCILAHTINLRDHPSGVYFAAVDILAQDSKKQPYKTTRTTRIIKK
jgi:hypothetical protein